MWCTPAAWWQGRGPCWTQAADPQTWSIMKTTVSYLATVTPPYGRAKSKGNEKYEYLSRCRTFIKDTSISEACMQPTTVLTQSAMKVRHQKRTQSLSDGRICTKFWTAWFQHRSTNMQVQVSRDRRRTSRAFGGGLSEVCVQRRSYFPCQRWNPIRSCWAVLCSLDLPNAWHCPHRMPPCAACVSACAQNHLWEGLTLKVCEIFFSFRKVKTSASQAEKTQGVLLHEMTMQDAHLLQALQMLLDHKPALSFLPGLSCAKFDWRSVAWPIPWHRFGVCGGNDLQRPQESTQHAHISWPHTQ